MEIGRCFVIGSLTVIRCTDSVVDEGNSDSSDEFRLKQSGIDEIEVIGSHDFLEAKSVSHDEFSLEHLIPRPCHEGVENVTAEVFSGEYFYAGLL